MHPVSACVVPASAYIEGQKHMYSLDRFYPEMMSRLSPY